MKLEPRALDGRAIRLLPFSESHSQEVMAAVLAHPEIWRFIPYAMASADDVRARFAEVAALHAAGAGAVFVTQHRESGALIGGTGVFVLDPRVPSFEIGATWIVPAHQRTRVNTEAKYLQLRYLFEELGAERVELKTDVRNERSRAAIERIGARPEGIVRRHMRRADGTLRDSASFSLIAPDWPDVKRALELKLS